MEYDRIRRAGIESIEVDSDRPGKLYTRLTRKSLKYFQIDDLLNRFEREHNRVSILIARIHKEAAFPVHHCSCVFAPQKRERHRIECTNDAYIPGVGDLRLSNIPHDELDGIGRSLGDTPIKNLSMLMSDHITWTTHTGLHCNNRIYFKLSLKFCDSPVHSCE